MRSDSCNEGWVYATYLLYLTPFRGSVAKVGSSVAKVGQESPKVSWVARILGRELIRK